MNYKGEIQYVRYYTAGSAAQKLVSRQDKHPQAKFVRTAAKPVRKVTLRIDPFALVGTAIAVVMVIGVLVGFFRVNRTNRTVAAMESHIAAVQAENSALKTQFEQGYDINEIKTAAHSMGLVPVEQVKHIRITVTEPEPEQKPGFWEELWEDIRELFA